MISGIIYSACAPGPKLRCQGRVLLKRQTSDSTIDLMNDTKAALTTRQDVCSRHKLHFRPLRAVSMSCWSFCNSISGCPLMRFESALMLEQNTSFEEEEVVNHAHRHDRKVILMFEMGVNSRLFSCTNRSRPRKLNVPTD